MRRAFFAFEKRISDALSLTTHAFQPAFPRISIDFRALKMKLKIMSRVDNNGHFYGKVLLYIVEWYGNHFRLYCGFMLES